MPIILDYAVVIVIVLAALVYSVVRIRKAFMEKGGGCNGNCEGCGKRDGCGNPPGK